jgi:hypothetical protein
MCSIQNNKINKYNKILKNHLKYEGDVEINDRLGVKKFKTFFLQGIYFPYISEHCYISPHNSCAFRHLSSVRELLNPHIILCYL